MRRTAPVWVLLGLLLFLSTLSCGGRSGSPPTAEAPLREAGWLPEAPTDLSRTAAGPHVERPMLFRRTTGRWYVATTLGPDGPTADEQFQYGGDPSDVPVAGDWVGTGTVLPGLFRRSTGLFYMATASGPQGPTADLKMPYGGDPSDLPVVGDWNGDGSDDVGVYRAGTGMWYLLTEWNAQGAVADLQVRFWEGEGGLPAPGDYDGDGYTDLALYYPATGHWHLDLDRDGTEDRDFHYGGSPDDLPLAGDMDGNGTADPVIYRVGTGRWYCLTERAGSTPIGDQQFTYGGDPSDIPVILDTNGDGVADPGVYRGSTGWWSVADDRQGSQINSDLKFHYGGEASDVPLTSAAVLQSTRPAIIPWAPLLEIVLSPDSGSLPKGAHRQFQARGRFGDNTWRDITAQAQWTFEPSAVASVAMGDVTGLALGSGTVTAEGDGGVQGSAPVTVTAAELVSLALSPADYTTLEALAVDYSLTGTYTDGTTATLNSQADFTSSVPEVAYVWYGWTPRGHVVAVAPGTTVISATVGSVSTSTSLKITRATLQKINLSPTRAGELVQTPARTVSFRATGDYDNGRTRTITQDCDWSSSSPAVATVTNDPDPAGVLTVLGAGLATLTAALDGVTKDAPVEGAAWQGVPELIVTDGSDTSSGTLSGDARKVLFHTTVALVPGDTNGLSDAYLKDLDSGAVERISLDSGGGEPDQDCLTGSLSRNGRFAAFYSKAEIVPGATNGYYNVFVRDRQAGTVARASLTYAGGAPSGDCYPMAVSDDGRYVLFSSAATNLVATDFNSLSDYFMRDLQGGTTTYVSGRLTGSPVAGSLYGARLSADGRVLAFRTAAGLDAADTNSAADLYVRDFDANTLTWVSRIVEGTQTLQGCAYFDLSGDARWIALVVGSKLWRRDLQTAQVIPYGGPLLAAKLGVGRFYAVSGDGDRVTFSTDIDLYGSNPQNPYEEQYVFDRVTGSLERIAIPMRTNRNVSVARLSEDGHTLVVSTRATNLFPGDVDDTPNLLLYPWP